MSSENQKIVIIKKEPCDKNNLYAVINLKALRVAMIVLRNESFRIWCYLAKNQNKYQFDLSKEACDSWGIKKDSYYTHVKTLIAKGYLVPIREGSNHYLFHELPDQFKSMSFESQNSKGWILDEKAIQDALEGKISEKPPIMDWTQSEIPKSNSENLNLNSELEKKESEKPERNNINIIKNNTTNNSTVGLAGIMDESDPYSSGTPVPEEIVDKRIDELHDIFMNEFGGFPSEDNLKQIAYLIGEKYIRPREAIIRVMHKIKEGDF